MTRFNKINNVAGWMVLVISTIVYWLTAEPTGSFWDCGEFIGCAYKLQVPHSPGAPLFIIIAHLVTLLAPDPSKVALTVNYFSGFTSALTNLFLFWTITALGIKILGKKVAELSGAEIIALIGAGLVGAFSNAFADSFWFSAVEGEVYASSSFFTAIVFWAILKWEQVADEPYGDRWIIFIGCRRSCSQTTPMVARSGCASASATRPRRLAASATARPLAIVLAKRKTTCCAIAAMASGRPA